MPKKAAIALTVFCVATCSMLGTAVHAAGKIRGNVGGMERSAALFSRDGRLISWTVTGPSGLYEFGSIEPGEYIMLLNGKIVPRLRVTEGKTTIIDQSRQPRFEIEKELWGPSRVSFAQSFVATGTAVTGFSLWRSSGSGKLTASLYEETPAGRRIGGPFTTAKEMVWVCSSSLPADEFATVPGKRYAIEIADANGKKWNHSMPRRSDVYPGGIAYYDGVAHAESDLGLTLYEQQPGLRCIARAREDLHFIAEGPGSGKCTVAGETFIANASNVVQAYALCGGWGGGVAEFVFSIHQDGPGGDQVGPACTVKMVCDWGADVVWFSDAVKLTVGKRYFFQYRRTDNKPFFSYLSKNVYPGGRAFRDGKVLDEQFDQMCSIYGEDEPDSVIYPYNAAAGDITSTSATVRWQTGNPGDSLVHFGATNDLAEQAGSEESRKTDHRISLEDLSPGTVYLYRVSSHTHKESSRRMYSRIYRFMTAPKGNDQPQFDKPVAAIWPEEGADFVKLANPGFELGTTGWKRIAQTGRDREGETFVPNAKPLGAATAGVDGYSPHSGMRLYGFSYFGMEDSTWKEPREDWKREIISQRIKVEKGRDYRLKAWILTGDRASGWGRDSRIRLIVDETDAGLLDSFDTIDRANVTQWFATRHQWMPATVRFTARSDHVTIGAEFLQWWALEACHLYIDEFSVRPVD